MVRMKGDATMKISCEGGSEEGSESGRRWDLGWSGSRFDALSFEEGGLSKSWCLRECEGVFWIFPFFWDIFRSFAGKWEGG